MKKAPLTAMVLLLYILSCLSGKLFALGEKTLVLGAASTWKSAETRIGVVEVEALRPNPVLVLASSRSAEDPLLDLALPFDEDRPGQFIDGTGHYRVRTGASVSTADRRLARAGSGAALFLGTGTAENGGDPLIIEPRNRDALFSEGRHVRDFSLELWLYPMHMENGEQILSWSSSRTVRGEHIFQRMRCAAVKNRLEWSFLDFFSSPDDGRRINLSFGSSVAVLPRTWSHHLIRFDADTGLFEYLVNGRLEAVRYATVSGREGGEVYTPVIGSGSKFVLGGRFMGLIDEFRFYGRYVERPELYTYFPEGRMETSLVDLGESGSSVLKIDAYGGRTAAAASGPAIQNEYAGKSRYRFPDGSALQFFIRASDNPYGWTEADWEPFEPGTDMGGIRGRFLQLAAVFYPSGDREASPYLDEIRITYTPDNPPHPPSMVRATARDGAVELSWRASPDSDTAGYMVYYGTARGEYFGEGAIQGASPIDAGKRTSLRIEGLRNGVLYYFAVTAYDRPEPLHGGEFSREVSARPLRTAE
jgi:hypothetical protein